MNNVIKQLIILVCLIAVLILPYFVFAASGDSAALDFLERVGPAGGYQEATDTTVASIVGTIITALMGLLGVIFLSLMIYGGYMWMSAQGDETKLEKAQAILRMAVVGLVIIIAAYAITRFIYTYVISGTGALNAN